MLVLGEPRSRSYKSSQQPVWQTRGYDPTQRRRVWLSDRDRIRFLRTMHRRVALRRRYGYRETSDRRGRPFRPIGCAGSCR